MACPSKLRSLKGRSCFARTVWHLCLVIFGTELLARKDPRSFASCPPVRRASRCIFSALLQKSFQSASASPVKGKVFVGPQASFRAAIQTSISTSVGLCHFRVGIKMQCGAFRSVACSSNWTTLWSETLLSQNSKLCIHSGLLHQIQSSERFPCHLVGAKVRSSFVAAHGLEDGCNVASSGQATGSTFQSPAINQGAPWRVKSWHSNMASIKAWWFASGGL